jgi:hypothetical protein
MNQHAGMSMDLALLGNRALQVAVRRNLVCFPSQAPTFGKEPRRNVQWKLAVLYFIRGWSTREIARRYGLTRERCGQIISDWRIRAVNMGYIQDVTPDDFDALALMQMKDEHPGDDRVEVRLALVK